MYAPDLATECEVASGDAVRAIGWLAAGQPFTRAPIDPRFLAALRSHASDPGRWMPFESAGVHFCDLGGCRRAGGSGVVIIPSRACVYVAPDLVEHYVEQHQYAPPAELVAAVLACPAQSSEAYIDLLLPFARIWSLDGDGVRRIGAEARSRRQPHAGEGGFKW